MIPQAAPWLRVARFKDAIDQAIGEVLAGRHLILGPMVEAFESEFAYAMGSAHGVGVNSGTDALILILRALGIGQGDEVITVSLTAAGTAHAVLLAGATPVFADVDPVTWVMDPDSVRGLIGPRTRAILPVHLFGFPAPIVALKQLADRHNLALVEDCAQSHGARIGEGRLGNFGAAAAFSFYPTKNLGGVGDGGVVITGDAGLAARLRALRNFGWTDDARISAVAAGNTRLDEMQAAVLRVLLKHLEANNAERRDIAGHYRQQLASTDLRLPPDAPGAVYHQFAVRHARRDAIAHHLRENHGIGTAVHYTPPLHRQPAFAGARMEYLPVTDRLAAELLSLPIQPEVAGPNRQRISDAILEALTLV